MKYIFFILILLLMLFFIYNKKDFFSNTKTCKEGTKPINIKGKLFCVGKCPHSGGPIVYDPNKDDLFCSWHNSRFKLDGKYKSGPAAGQNLKISK